MKYQRMRLAADQLPRSPGDCVRMCVSVAYGFDYRSLPSLIPEKLDAPRLSAERVLAGDEFWRSWDRWAAEQGLRWWRHDQLGPIFLPRWIAGVQDEGEPHAVVMSYDRLLDDPNAARPWEDATFPCFKSISPAGVHDARVLLPADQTTIKGKGWWRLKSRGRIVPLTNPD